MAKIASTYINPLTDFGFKFLFGKDANKDFLLSFLNALMGEDESRQIVDVVYIDKEHKGESADNRTLIYDLQCRTADGRTFIVEMQNRYQTHFASRAIYYMSSALASQGKQGDDWAYNLTPVYGVFIMNFDWRDPADRLLREDVTLFSNQAGKEFSDKFRMTFLKVPLLDKDAADCKSTIERWIYLLKNMETMHTMPESFRSNPVFSRLDKVARVGALDPMARSDYERSLKAYRDTYAIVQTERSEGMEEGISIGINIGRKEGREEGIKEKEKAVIGNMRSMGLDDETISKFTGIPLDSFPKI